MVDWNPDFPDNAMTLPALDRLFPSYTLRSRTLDLAHILSHLGPWSNHDLQFSQEDLDAAILELPAFAASQRSTLKTDAVQMLYASLGKSPLFAHPLREQLRTALWVAFFPEIPTHPESDAVLLQWAIHNAHLLAHHNLGSHPRLWQAIANFPSKLPVPPDSLIGVRAATPGTRQVAFNALVEQRTKAGLDSLVSDVRNGGLMLLDDLTAGRFDTARARMEKGADVKTLHLDSFTLAYALGKPGTGLSPGQIQTLWGMLLEAGGRPVSTIDPQPARVLPGPVLRAEVEAGHTPALTQWLGVVHGQTWMPDKASGKDAGAWLVRHGVDLSAIDAFSLSNALSALLRDKAGTHRMVDAMVAQNTRILPGSLADPDDRRPQMNLTKFIGVGIDARRLQSLLDLGLDPLEPAQYDVNTLFQILRSKKGKAGPSLSVLLPAMEKADPEQLKHMLTERRRNGSTLIHEAAKQFDLGALVLLQKRGADMDAVDNQGNTFLHWTTRLYGATSQLRLFPVLQWALETGFDLGVKNKRGQTVFAAMTRVATVDSLLAALASNLNLLDAVDRKGKTPRDYLLRRSDGGTVTPMVEKGVLEMKLPDAGEQPETKAPRRRL